MKNQTHKLFSFFLHGIFLFNLMGVSAIAQIEPINLSKGWEVWYDQVPISGEIRVGILDDFKTSPINKQSFFVQIPQHNEKRLCVLLSSRDGRYKAELSYEIENLPSGRHEFKWPTSYISKLSKFTGQDMTILCSVSNSCEEDPVYYAYASWDKANVSDTLFVLVNSDIPPKIVFDRGDPSKNTTFNCKKMNVRSGVAFNCLCEVPKEEVQRGGDIFVVKRVVRPGGRVTFIRYPLPLKP